MYRRSFIGASLATAVAAALPGSRSLAALLQATSDIEAVTGDGTEVVLERAAVHELADSLRGDVLLTGSDGYDAARRVINKAIDRYPALIVRPTGVADVSKAVTFARERNLLLAVKCGGHSYAGKSTCDRGMQIDLSRLRGARVDPASRTAYVEGGSLLGDLDHEAMAHGLVTTAGTVSHTGVGGLTLAGGFGRLGRRFGLTLDNVAGFDLVTADGRYLHASEQENADLFWGLRGGGGNFGVVTSFEFRLHPMQRQVVAGDVVFPLARARDVLGFYADFSATAPDELSAELIMASPPGDADGVVLLHCTFSGEASRASDVLAPLDKLGTPLANTIGPIDYVALQSSWDDSDPRNGGEYLKSGFTREIGGGLVDALVDGFDAHPERGTSVVFQQAGGAIGRVAGDATAFAHRYASHNLMVVVAWEPTVARGPHVDYIRRYWGELENHTRGYYTVDTGNEAQSVINSNYQGNFERLLKLKRRYDPTNLFRLNANIRLPGSDLGN
jgi:FAD/FMN-containing dehydrogenase